METLTNCPICNNDTFIPFIEISTDGEYYLCDCGCAFLNPRMTEEELVEYYRSGEYRENTSELDPDNILGTKQSRDRASYIGHMVRKVKAETFLDIGCYKSDLLKEVSGLIPGVVCSGVDPDPKMKNSTFTVYKSVDEIKETFDLITCIQTLEHVLNPVPFMDKVYSLLNKDGVLLVEVPNRRANMVAFVPPHHVIAYDEKSLHKVMEKFSIVKTILHGQPDRSPLDLNLLVLATKG